MERVDGRFDNGDDHTDAGKWLVWFLWWIWHWLSWVDLINSRGVRWWCWDNTFHTAQFMRKCCVASVRWRCECCWKQRRREAVWRQGQLQFFWLISFILYIYIVVAYFEFQCNVQKYLSLILKERFAGMLFSSAVFIVEDNMYWLVA